MGERIERVDLARIRIVRESLRTSGGNARLERWCRHIPQVVASEVGKRMPGNIEVHVGLIELQPVERLAALDNHRVAGQTQHLLNRKEAIALDEDSKSQRGE